jgi:hypothetical protein
VTTQVADLAGIVAQLKTAIDAMQPKAV